MRTRCLCLIIVHSSEINRPGSAAVSATFFAKMSDMLDPVATFIESILLMGDVNVRLERSTRLRHRSVH